ncbi:hypothetical protein [Methanosalsum natronophilum]|uniref:hypothetical protein n=1 Tax=Methanosalsum natronophilum TaxID=768733 RepID=UPI0021676B6D|nr:hypothetical protein [Methanosalsum natronophilum]MCS3924666.1 two-component sensor histidine kinase [Methanosalsum natronophilum]
MKELVEDQYVFEMGDNGAGIPRSTNSCNSRSLGLRLIDMLVLQLGAKIDIDCTQGTHYTIKIKK